MRFSLSGFFWLSSYPSHTWAHIKYPSSLCVRTPVYKHTHTHHPDIASSKMSASGAPTNVAFPPSPTHLFTAFIRAWLSHKYSMGFVIGVPRNAKTKATSSGRFELDPSSSRPTFLCCIFLCFRRFTLRDGKRHGYGTYNIVRWAQAHRRMVCWWRTWARHAHRGQRVHQTGDWFAGKFKCA